VRAAAADSVTIANKWRSREKQERAVRVERAREDVCGRVFVRRARVVDSV